MTYLDNKMLNTTPDAMKRDMDELAKEPGKDSRQDNPELVALFYGIDLPEYHENQTT